MGEALFRKLADAARTWQTNSWQCSDYPLIGEILRWQFVGDEIDESALKYLRKPQFRALEVYWYLRLVRKTPHIISLYREIYGDDKRALFKALGANISEDMLEWAKTDAILNRVREDEGYAREHQLDSLHEAITLAYPSYIFALAMGAGKTVLIGAIVATEFAMSLAYPTAQERFMKNALVFAPGTTILESLRELQDVPYENILPPTQHKQFLANLKLEYPRAGAKEIQAQKDSIYNLIVTNTEKISLRVHPRRKHQSKLEFEKRTAQAELTANLRLQKIASLPDLGIFSDEAHHTYGNTAGEELKRMRETVNWLNNETKIVAVINTTGTPYYKRALLKEVVVWYGLGEGIDDGILKSLHEGISQYRFRDLSEEQVIIRNIIGDFLEKYGDVSTPKYGRAKIAFYFKTQEHLDTTRVFIEESLATIGEPATQILVNTQKSSRQEIDDFNRLDSPESQKRVILLVGKGTEGWNCRSLFATALIRKQTGGTFVLQAATRCLRQVPGNDKPARVYLDFDNATILDQQLQNNFRTDLYQIAQHDATSKQVPIRILKFDEKLPKLEITKTRTRVIRSNNVANRGLALARPRNVEIPSVLRSIFTPTFEGTGEILTPTGEIEEIELTSSEKIDCYAAAMRITANYHLPPLPILKTLRRLYPEGEIPAAHLYALFSQVEQQTADYEITEEKITEALALIHIRDRNGKLLFEQDTDGSYVHTLRFSRRKPEDLEMDNLLLHKKDEPDTHDISFHYTPYNFDSRPEHSLFTQLLSSLNMNLYDIRCFLFTGGLTDPAKSDFHFEYKTPNDGYHLYFPDFVIVKNSGEFFVVEVKKESDRDDRIVKAKEKAVRKITNIQPDKFRYHIVYTLASTVPPEESQPVMNWIRGGAE